MPKRRLGVVLLVPEPWATEIDGIRRALGDGALGRIPTHLTLVPPVNVRDDRMPDALAVLRRAAQSTRPFSVHLGPPTTFHPVNPVVYLAVDQAGSAEVHRLRDAIFAGPLERHLTWDFVPHVTLADDADHDRIGPALAALSDYETDLVFDRVHLLEEGEARVWRPVADVPFAPAAVVGRGGLDVTLEHAHDLDPEALAWTERTWSAYALDEYGATSSDEPFAIVARRDGQIAGTAAGQLRPDDAYLARLVVSEAERRTGVGSRLLAAVEALAAERGCRRLVLHTQADGPARQFYEGRGWTVVIRMPQWRNGRDFVQMERRLG